MQKCNSISDMGGSDHRRSCGPPHNPGLRKLIEGKRCWSAQVSIEDTKHGFRGWNERGYLPHRDAPGLTQFVTFRLRDSFPESLRAEWLHLWHLDDPEERRAALEAYLDKGKGACFLQQPKIGQLVEDGLLFFHGARYELRAWVVMPNHVHSLFKVRVASLALIIGSWKKHTAIQANRFLKRRGEFWQADYWDTYMRTSTQELQTRLYIENNPVKAGLVQDPKAWPWSSAKFRDAHGSLALERGSG